MAEGAVLIERLRRAIGKNRYLGPVADARIDSAEERLSTTFPVSYREFLRHFGAAQLSPRLEIAGLPEPAGADETPLWEDVVALNLRNRRSSRGHIPDSFLRIADDGTDYAFYLDTGAWDEAGECCVRLLGPGRDCVSVAGSFLEFIDMIATGGIETALK